ncbi:MAG: hypothetical protein ACOYVF_05600 [Candidatus Zixiibacteriota bacterium]
MDQDQIKTYLENLLGKKMKNRPIRALDVNPRYHGSPKLHIEEGQPCAGLEPGAPGEIVLGIFEADFFCVCTAGRGAGKGIPYLFHRQDVLNVSYR